MPLSNSLNQRSGLLGVVLCGGRSRRMGIDKATLKTCDGHTYLDRAVSRLAQVSEEIWISRQADQAWTHPLATRSIIDPLIDGGPLIGICQCMRQAHATARQPKATARAAVMFCPIDLPDLEVVHLQALIDRFHQHPILTVAQFSKMQPLLGIYPTRHLGEIQSAIDQRHYGVTRWVQSVDHQTVALPSSVGRNVNDPDDLGQPHSNVGSTKPKGA
jgi:molybdenum cofactor guanylyltransferase